MEGKFLLVLPLSCTPGLHHLSEKPSKFDVILAAYSVHLLSPRF